MPFTLTDTHLVILSAAAAHADLLVPATIKLHGNLRTATRSLIETGYVEVVPVTRDGPAHDANTDGHPTGLRITPVGRAVSTQSTFVPAPMRDGAGVSVDSYFQGAHFRTKRKHSMQTISDRVVALAQLVASVGAGEELARTGAPDGRRSARDGHVPAAPHGGHAPSPGAVPGGLGAPVATSAREGSSFPLAEMNLLAVKSSGLPAGLGFARGQATELAIDGQPRPGCSKALLPKAKSAARSQSDTLSVVAPLVSGRSRDWGEAIAFADSVASAALPQAGMTLGGPATARVLSAAALLAMPPVKARLALGVDAVDAVLGGGLDRAGLHEIHASGPGDEAATAGFVAGLAVLSLTSPSGPVPSALGSASSGGLVPGHAAHGDAIAWVETRFSATEDGLLWPAGLEDLGLAPKKLVRVSVGRIVDALAAAEETLACDALAATVLEIRGPAPALDLVALRRLALAAKSRRRPCLLLRTGATSQPTPALTRWAIAARPTGAAAGAAFRRQMGLPAFAATLTRQRAGREGAWILEWCADAQRFREPLPQPALSVPDDRPAVAVRRRTG